MKAKSLMITGTLFLALGLSVLRHRHHAQRNANADQQRTETASIGSRPDVPAKDRRFPAAINRAPRTPVLQATAASPPSSPNQSSLNEDEKRELAAVYQSEQAQIDFLKSIGLRSADFARMRAHEDDYHRRIHQFVRSHGVGGPAVTQYRAQMLKWHEAWMEAFVGTDNYERLLQVSQESAFAQN